MSSCRYCGEDAATELMSQRDWLAFARGCDDSRPVIAKLVDADPALAFDGLVECRACGFRSVATVPGDDALGRFYRGYMGNTGYAAKRDKKIARAKRWIGGVWKAPAGGRFLDVGCNQGFAVEAARQLGFEATGIEIDSEAVARAREAFPENAYEESAVGPWAESRAGGYDLVYCSEVIEHVPDFHAFAKALASLVAPGGMLFLTTPDAGHWRTPKPFAEWAEVKPPEHLNYFTRGQLKALFEEAGLTVGFRFKWKPGMHLVGRRRA